MSASGPLVARWRTLEHVQFEAGALRNMTIEVENAGTAAWRTRGPEEGLYLSYHWLDERGNPIVWDGRRTRFPQPLVCPSLLAPLEPNAEVAGLPAYTPEGDEPYMFDGRLAIRLRSRSGRRRS